MDLTLKKMNKRFNIEVTIDSYITEWNKLSFRYFRTKKEEKSSYKILDMLCYHAQELQLLLVQTYLFHVLLWDCIIRAFESGPFYDPSTEMFILSISEKPHTEICQTMKTETFSRLHKINVFQKTWRESAEVFSCLLQG